MTEKQIKAMFAKLHERFPNLGEIVEIVLQPDGTFKVYTLQKNGAPKIGEHLFWCLMKYEDGKFTVLDY